jgi:hypothetical protein
MYMQDNYDEPSDDKNKKGAKKKTGKNGLPLKKQSSDVSGTQVKGTNLLNVNYNAHNAGSNHNNGYRHSMSSENV